MREPTPNPSRREGTEARQPDKTGTDEQRNPGEDGAACAGALPPAHDCAALALGPPTPSSRRSSSTEKNPNSGSALYGQTAELTSRGTLKTRAGRAEAKARTAAGDEAPGRAAATASRKRKKRACKEGVRGRAEETRPTPQTPRRATEAKGQGASRPLPRTRSEPHARGACSRKLSGVVPTP